MARYFVDVRMTAGAPIDLSRIERTLRAANARLARHDSGPRTLMAGFGSTDGRLLCVVDASDVDSVRQLMSTALLPPGRILEILPLIWGPDG